jgi:hypothetical protein
MNDNLTRAFARWNHAPRTRQSPSQWANPFDVPEPKESASKTILLAAAAFIAVTGYLLLVAS